MRVILAFILLGITFYILWQVTMFLAIIGESLDLPFSYL